MTIASTWRGNPYAEGAGAFFLLYNQTLTTDWANIVDIRAMAGRSDVLALVQAQGLTGADVATRAVIKRVLVQNMGSAEAYLSTLATAGVATPPAPTDAYLIVQADGGGVTLDFPTRMEQLKVQARASAGTCAANVIVWFDVPQAI